MNHRSRLLSPYPGAKNPAVYPVHDGGDYDCWVAPFAGSGEQEAWLARHYPGLPVIAADADPMVRAVWECWRTEKLRKSTRLLVQAWKERVLKRPEETFQELAELATFDSMHRNPLGYNPVAVAAVSIILRRLTFGGVMRFNDKGVFNVGLSQDKLNTLRDGGWAFEWPEPPQVLTVFNSWAKAAQVHPLATRAIAIVDPPYCAGTTDAYANADGDYTMALDCISDLLASGNVARIVAFNYWGEWVEGNDAPTEYPICKAMQVLAHKYSVDVYFSHLGTLATMNKAADKAAVHRYEGVWEIGGRRLYGSRPIVKPSSERVEQMALML
jgi:site-specific DNA-adenine methylase